MIEYNLGNPLIEVGYCTLAALVGKTRPAELEPSDYNNAANYIEEKYLRPGAWRNFLAGAVFPNSGFAQYSYDKPHLEYKKREYAASVLRRYQPDIPVLEGKHCAFCGRDAVFIATREHIPLLNAQGYINFSPQGHSGLPVCGMCLLAAHAMPLGCQVVGGRLLAVYSEDKAITIAFADQALREMRRILFNETLEKIPSKRFPKTRLIEALVNTKVVAERLRGRRGSRASITAYYFTNSGQSADIDIIELPSQVVDFLYDISRSDESARPAWEYAVNRGWLFRKNKGEDEFAGAINIALTKNELYEDIFDLPGSASYFLRRHILPVHSWELTRFFLRKVMNMDPKVIDLLHELGSRFAEYVLAEKRGFYYDFAREQDYTKWRRHLIEATYDCTRKYNKTLISSEEFIRAFTKPRDADKYWSWKLPRDIVTLRILEEWVKAGEPLPEDATLFGDTPEEDEE